MMPRRTSALLLIYLVGHLSFTSGKVFLGACNYEGFCEQACRLVGQDMMECYCNDGYIIQDNGRKCDIAPEEGDVEPPVTDASDDSSGSGEKTSVNANCDDEDEDCSGEGVETTTGTRATTTTTTTSTKQENEVEASGEDTDYETEDLDGDSQIPTVTTEVKTEQVKKTNNTTISSLATSDVIASSPRRKPISVASTSLRDVEATATISSSAHVPIPSSAALLVDSSTQLRVGSTSPSSSFRSTTSMVARNSSRVSNSSHLMLPHSTSAQIAGTSTITTKTLSYVTNATTYVVPSPREAAVPQSSSKRLILTPSSSSQRNLLASIKSVTTFPDVLVIDADWNDIYNRLQDAPRQNQSNSVTKLLATSNKTLISSRDKTFRSTNATRQTTSRMPPLTNTSNFVEEIVNVDGLNFCRRSNCICDKCLVERESVVCMCTEAAPETQDLIADGRDSAPSSSSHIELVIGKFWLTIGILCSYRIM